MNRRHFLTGAAAVGGLALTPKLITSVFGFQKPAARVAFIKTTDRVTGVNRAIDLLGVHSFKGRDIFIKPNFNSADTPPGSTHIDTLSAVIDKLRKLNAGQMTVGDRSGMGRTREVMEAKDVFHLAKDAKVNTIVFDELTANDWVPVKKSGHHWSQGFALPKQVVNAGAVVQTCCLKTHRFGGHFTLSLKNSVGLAAKTVPGDSYNYMRELHGSPNQRTMIAEINSAYQPALIVLDGIDAFVNGGPDKGQQVSPQIILAGTDRVAIDAVGVALLRYYGTTPEVTRGKIFEQDQIARAVQLGIGISSPDQIDLVTNDPASAEFAKKIRPLLNQ
ncbi:MAG TPA: DUF362 domain-containing protein [Pyrinomonadaceae bacterium]|nr:DUF362 domain-containing protein [Pyrinomonadaceae bacterium]